jgi:polar amino acid transport system ATP-binding protein
MIKIVDLVKRHGELEVIRGVSMEVERGSVHAIIGPSGGGKSTFLRCVNGLEAFQGGEVHVGEHRLTPATHPARDAGLLQAVRRRVGFVFQQFNLFPHLTVLENLTEAPRQVLRMGRDEADARAERLLRRVGLGEKAAAYPRHLSGGQQQRVAIARALAMEPEAILFDEPTSALDPVMAAEVLGVMRDLAAAGQTMLVVTHSMSFARSAAGFVHVFAGGRAVECGPPEQVLGQPAHETTRAFLGSAGGGGGGGARPPPPKQKN